MKRVCFSALVYQHEIDFSRNQGSESQNIAQNISGTILKIFNKYKIFRLQNSAKLIKLNRKSNLQIHLPNLFRRKASADYFGL